MKVSTASRSFKLLFYCIFFVSANCSTGEWACVGSGDNRCIPEAWLCDGISDCPTGIDEVIDECISISSNCSHLSNGQLKLLAIASSELRTSLGISPPRGLLQVYVNGVHGGIRADGWNVDGTNVACRQLGLGPGMYLLKCTFMTGFAPFF